MLLINLENNFFQAQDRTSSWAHFLGSLRLTYNVTPPSEVEQIDADTGEVKRFSLIQLLQHQGYGLTEAMELKVYDGENNVLTNENFSYSTYQNFSNICKIVELLAYQVLTVTSNRCLKVAPVFGSFCFVSPDFESNQEVLMILINGEKAPAGLWSMKLAIEKGYNTGSQQDYIDLALENGVSVLCMNSYNNFDEDCNPICGNETPQAHANNVWKLMVQKSPAQKIVIVSQTPGFFLIMKLMEKFTDDFEKRVVAIQMIDCDNHDNEDAYLEIQETPANILSKIQHLSTIYEANNAPAGADVTDNDGKTKHPVNTLSIGSNSEELKYQRSCNLIMSCVLSHKIKNTTLRAASQGQEQPAPDPPSFELERENLAGIDTCLPELNDEDLFPIPSKKTQISTATEVTEADCIKELFSKHKDEPLLAAERTNPESSPQPVSRESSEMIFTCDIIPEKILPVAEALEEDDAAETMGDVFDNMDIKKEVNLEDEDNETAVNPLDDISDLTTHTTPKKVSADKRSHLKRSFSPESMAINVENVLCSPRKQIKHSSPIEVEAAKTDDTRSDSITIPNFSAKYQPKVYSSNKNSTTSSDNNSDSGSDTSSTDSGLLTVSQLSLISNVSSHSKMTMAARSMEAANDTSQPIDTTKRLSPRGYSPHSSTTKRLSPRGHSPHSSPQPLSRASTKVIVTCDIIPDKILPVSETLEEEDAADTMGDVIADMELNEELNLEDEDNEYSIVKRGLSECHSSESIDEMADSDSATQAAPHSTESTPTYEKIRKKKTLKKRNKN